MKRRPVLAASLVAAIFALTACASTSSQTATAGARPSEAGSPSAFGVDTSGIGPTASVATDTPTAPAAAPSSEPSAEASSGPCVTHACIVADAKQLRGTVAKDNAVMTRVSCIKSTVKQVTPGTYTVHCTITYSDGMIARGIASVLTGTGEVDWEPTQVLSYGSGA